MLTYWLWLQSLPHINIRQKLALLAYFHDPEELYRADSAMCREITDLTLAGCEALENKDLTAARKLAAQCAQKRIGLLTYGDSAYPERLRNIPDPPLVLYYRGMLPSWNDVPVIGVVGTRKASAYGLQIAATMGAQIAACGGLVISGAATGVDRLAMEYAIKQEKPVVGVLGCGVDLVYPKSNAKLFEDTLRQGCLISEYAPGTPAYRWNFPQRNRIISGISNGVLVVEAPEVSGALITARYAMEQGRDVFVVPGNINAVESAGSNQLLREGAMAAFEGYGILREYESRYPGQITCTKPAVSYTQEGETPEKQAQKPAKPQKKPIDKGNNSQYSVLNSEKPPLTQEEAVLVAHLSQTPMAVDELIALSGLPAPKAISLLTVLGLKGVVEHHPGKSISVKIR